MPNDAATESAKSISRRKLVNQTLRILAIVACLLPACKQADNAPLQEIIDRPVVEKQDQGPTLTAESDCQNSPDGTKCDDQNGCTTNDLCQKGQCVGQKPLYSVAFTSEESVFSCRPCKKDFDCQFKSKVFCQSHYGPPLIGPWPMRKPTGKCQEFACEFEASTCEDGDPKTSEFWETPPG
ncbi:MAG: hypothetical protein NT034_03395 [Candidatus Magasanikbacteria bacterium]|nr:hypothetical protein [Candidatus Magasanikbacteria bacterium]